MIMRNGEETEKGWNIGVFFVQPSLKVSNAVN